LTKNNFWVKKLGITILPYSSATETLFVDHSIFYKNDSLNTKEEDEDCAEFSDTPFSSEIDFFQSFIGIPHLSTNSISVGNYVGSGAFGEVYKGQWRNRSVALKTIDISHAKNYLYGSLSKDESFEEQILEALQWEVSRLSTVSHPNCVQFYGLFQFKSKIHLVMEFCDGGTVQGLCYLHENGILHRDLKCENILLDKNNTAKLADLGVSQVDSLLEDKEAKVVEIGLQDQRFISPENLLNPTLSSQSTDIFSMGHKSHSVVTDIHQGIHFFF